MRYAPRKPDIKGANPAPDEEIESNRLSSSVLLLTALRFCHLIFTFAIPGDALEQADLGEFPMAAHSFLIYAEQSGDFVVAEPDKKTQLDDLGLLGVLGCE